MFDEAHSYVTMNLIRTGHLVSKPNKADKSTRGTYTVAKLQYDLLLRFLATSYLKTPGAHCLPNTFFPIMIVS